jgi:two-component system NtrC family sensor kinase
MGGHERDEASRLQALRDLELLDTPAEETFDALTRLCCSQLDVPISLVSLVDEHRQWFKSRQGLDLAETARSISFCTHVVDLDGPLIVEDAAQDPRFATNPLVLGAPQFRFYAGWPLRTAEGDVLGTFCALDLKPRQFDAKERAVLEALTGQASLLIQMRGAQARLRAEHVLLEARDAALAASERRLRALFEGLSEAVILQNAVGTITACNPSAERIFGLSADQILGRTPSDLVPQATREDGMPRADDAFPSAECLRTGLPVDGASLRLSRADGQRRSLRVNARPLFNDAVTLSGVVTTFTDVTEERALAERVNRQERLVTTGTLAAGVGHEINNPLAYILANVDFALNELQRDAGESTPDQRAELTKALEQVKTGALRVRDIVRGLKALARDDGPVVATQIAPVVAFAVTLTRPAWKATAQVQAFVEDLPLVLADEARLTQVLVHLLLNAVGALPGPDLENNRIQIHAEFDETHLRLQVTDNGRGIAATTLNRIFDPFFTTKPVGQGVGLGLSIAHSLVASMGGELTCTSTSAAGTCFTVSLARAL